MGKTAECEEAWGPVVKCRWKLKRIKRWKRCTLVHVQQVHPLELSTYPTSALHLHQWDLQCWRSLPGQLCIWAERTWLAVGMVKGCGHNGQQTDAHLQRSWIMPNDSKRIQTTFCWFQLIAYTYKFPRLLDFKIWWFTWWPQQTDKPTDRFLYPMCIHAG